MAGSKSFEGGYSTGSGERRRWYGKHTKSSNAALLDLAASVLHAMHHRYLSALVVTLCMQAGDSPANGKDFDDRRGESGWVVVCNVSSGFSLEISETADHLA